MMSASEGWGMAETKPIGSIISELAEEDPDRPSVTCAGVTVSRRELDQRANRMARAYEGLGVGEGRFVTIALPNSIEFFVATLAVWKLGAIPQPVSSRLPARERHAIIELADPALVVGVDASEHPERTTVPIGFTPDPSLDDSPLPDRVSPSWKAPTSGGSTGRPKLIVAGGTSEMERDFGAGFRMERDETQLIPGPLYHNAPFSFSSLGLMMGHHLVVMTRFDAIDALELIGTYRVSFVNLVPTMMHRMCRAIETEPDRFDLTSLRIVWHMAAPCPEWLKQAWIDLVGAEKIMELYGGTEGQAMTVLDGIEWLGHRGSVGRTVTGEMVVLDAEGNPLPPGEVGEIFMRVTPGAPQSYHYIGAEPRSLDGWESLGDMGWMDADGYLYLSDRRTDLILSGGANVYPAEVEAAITEYPGVVSCCVVGLPDDDLGQRAHAIVQAGPGVTAADILAFLGERLVRYKIPRSIEFLDEPLRDDAGKVRRSAMREAAIARRSAGP
jgi:bile acid-coenzyme A ligase